MKSDFLPAWARTTSLDLAAAVSVLGISIGLDQSQDKISGRGWKTFLLGLESVPMQDIGAKPLEGEAEPDPLPSHNTQTVVSMIRCGKLMQADPHHPALDVLRVCRARELLTHWTRTGTRYRLVKAPNAERYQLVEGEEPESVKQSAPGLMTRSLKLAACLCVLGCPIVRIGGSSGSHEFYFAMRGYGFPPPIAGDLSQSYRSKRLAEIEPEHPLLWMMQGLSNRDAIGDMMNRKKKLILIRAPGTGRASLVPENATGKRMDAVKKHLGIV